MSPGAWNRATFTMRPPLRSGCSSRSTSSTSVASRSAAGPVGVEQDLGELGQQPHVPVALGGDADAHRHPLAVPVDAVGEAQHADRVVPHDVLAGQRCRAGWPRPRRRRWRSTARARASPRCTPARPRRLDAGPRRTGGSRRPGPAAARVEPDGARVEQRRRLRHRRSPPFLIGVDQLGHGRVADEDLERHDRPCPGRSTRARAASPAWQTHHVGVGRDRVDRGVLHRRPRAP